MKEDKDCIFKEATTHQRGHTCWFDTAVITLANTNSMREIHDNKPGGLKRFKKRLSDEIFEHGGDSKYTEKLHKTISNALGEDACPRKPTEGHDMLAFLKALMDMNNIEYMEFKVPNLRNTPTLIEGSEEHSCERFGMVDIEVYLEENFAKMLNKKKGTGDNGVVLVQFRGTDSDCFKLDCPHQMNIDTPYGTYVLSISSMTVSESGHVMSFGRCRDQRNWTVFDNEYTGVGFSPRSFEAENFDLVKKQMFTFPHTYFDPKHGPIQMNPFFKKGIRSATVFVYDFIKWEDN